MDLRFPFLCIVLSLLVACAGPRHKVVAEKDRLPGSASEVYAAFQTVAVAEGLRIVKDDATSNSFRVDGEFTDGTSFSITGKQAGVDTTAVSVLVGRLGDDPRAVMLLEKLEAELP